MAKIIYASGLVAEVKPANGKWFTLEEKQRIVGGNIEIVPSREGNWLVVNEEGKLEGLPINRDATLLYAYGIMTSEKGFVVHDVLAGDVLYCSEKELSKPERYQ
ncbi:MAG: DUF3846 domain-containing protein [Bacteroidales bacterium]|nr:DUF3846 domain-containing protein [Bacteroidales bacterium]